MFTRNGKLKKNIKFALDLTYLYYTNLQLLGLVVSDKNIFKCLPETGNWRNY